MVLPMATREADARLVTTRPTRLRRGSVSAPELLERVLRCPAGKVMVAVFVTLPRAEGRAWADRERVRELPAGRSRTVLRLPVPAATLLLAPPVPLVTDQLAPLRLKMVGGSASARVTPGTSLGPALVTTMTYVVGCPGRTMLLLLVT